MIVLPGTFSSESESHTGLADWPQAIISASLWGVRIAAACYTGARIVSDVLEICQVWLRIPSPWHSLGSFLCGLVVSISGRISVVLSFVIYAEVIRGHKDIVFLLQNFIALSTVNDLDNFVATVLPVQGHMSNNGLLSALGADRVEGTPLEKLAGILC